MREDSELERDMASLLEDGEEELLGAHGAAAREAVLREFGRYVSSMERYCPSSGLRKWALAVTILAVFITAVELVFLFIMAAAGGKAGAAGYGITLIWTAITLFFLLKTRAAWKDYKKAKGKERQEAKARRKVLQKLQEKAEALDQAEEAEKRLERTW